VYTSHDDKGQTDCIGGGCMITH